MKPRTLLGALAVLALLACGDATSPATDPIDALTGTWAGTWEFGPGEWSVGDDDGFSGRLHAEYTFGAEEHEDVLYPNVFAVWNVEIFDVNGEVWRAVNFGVIFATLSFDPPVLVLDGTTPWSPRYEVHNEGRVAADMSRIDLVARPAFALACVYEQPGVCQGVTAVASEPIEIPLTLRSTSVPP